MKCIKDYVVFEGRSRRREFWFFALVYFVIALIVGILDSAIGTPGAGSVGGGLLTNLLGLALLLPSLAVGARRLHDTDKSGWWLLLGLTGIGIIVLIVFWVQDSDVGDNTHGSNPKLEPIPSM